MVWNSVRVEVTLYIVAVAELHYVILQFSSILQYYLMLLLLLKFKSNSLPALDFMFTLVGILNLATVIDTKTL